MSFKSALSWIGHEAGAIFNWVGSAKGQAVIQTVEADAAGVATVVEGPAAGAVLTGLENLFNAGLKEVVGVEALSVAAAQQSGTGEQKGSAVATKVAPVVSTLLQTLGESKPSADKVQSISELVADSFAKIINALPAPTGTAATATSTATEPVAAKA